MARKTDENGQRLPVHDCPVHGEYISDAPDSPCPGCEDGLGAVCPETNGYSITSPQCSECGGFHV